MISCIWLGQNRAYYKQVGLALFSVKCLTKRCKGDGLIHIARSDLRYNDPKYFPFATCKPLFRQLMRSFKELLSILFCLVAKKYLFCADWSNFPIVNLVVYSSFTYLCRRKQKRNAPLVGNHLFWKGDRRYREWYATYVEHVVVTLFSHGFCLIGFWKCVSRIRWRPKRRKQYEIETDS